eukprot:CAMPEP_0115250142 /NCGR_PEP_ID=MMETSP0270-20121206/42954_1 /TAXON_ID=71861 /ORGANISM="Scrippsiella trochoidea, Strain CCMP3099" /LENGTH=195 /DNA_ID=CAMNT_0002665507 /DNA_START=19 /DNA_END=606 /DNA_ORIENTATION=+
MAAAARHDRFNLFTIPPLVLLTGLSLLCPCEAMHSALSWSVLAYIVADIIYNILVPHCQPGPVRLATILVHHLLTAWLVLHPIAYAENGHFTAYCSIVEVNTVCQVFYKVTKLKIFQMGFMLTWFSMRLIWFPYLIFVFHRTMVQQDQSTYTYCQVVGSQVLLVGLNVFWSAEQALINRRAAQPGREDGAKAKET